MPSATGTGTLVIHLLDYNDNAPYVVPSVARVCEDAHDMNVAIVGGRDRDLTPNAAPFKIELGKQPGLDKTWKISRVNCEYSVCCVPHCRCLGRKRLTATERCDERGQMSDAWRTQLTDPTLSELC